MVKTFYKFDANLTVRHSYSICILNIVTYITSFISLTEKVKMFYEFCCHYCYKELNSRDFNLLCLIPIVINK